MGRTILFPFAVLLLAACGGSDGGPNGSIESPCDLADAALVQEHFAGTVAEGVEGSARNCSFEIEGGEATSVDVFYFGNASGWEGTKKGYEENRGGVTEVDGLGDDAYFPNDAGDRELVVSAGGEIFAVTAFTGFEDPSSDAVASVRDLAAAIAAGLNP